MLTQTGFVTDAILAVNTVRQRNSYYKWLHFGKWSWVVLGCQTARLAMLMFPRLLVNPLLAAVIAGTASVAAAPKPQISVRYRR
ncbi:MAG: hypothetical protein WCG31_05640 [Deltaproteobacteria bacterium]